MTLKHFWTNLDDCIETDSPLSYSRGRVLEASAYESKVMTDDPVGYWKLDETSGTTMTDSSGFARDGVYLTTGTELGGQPLRSGAKASLNITSINGGAYIPQGDFATAVPGDKSWALEAVVNMSSVGAGSVFKNVFGMLPGQSTGSSPYAIIWSGTGLAYPSGKFDFNNRLLTGNIAAVDVAVHVLFEYDRVNSDTATVYVNGIAHGSVSVATSDTDSSKIFVGGGATNFPASYGMIGSISDIAIYDHALGANRALIHAQAGGFSPL